MIPHKPKRLARTLILPNNRLMAAVMSILAALTIVAAQAQAPAQGARELVLTVGKSLVVNSAATIERIAVGYGEIAEARAVGPKEILIDGKAPGKPASSSGRKAATSSSST